jgi:hypothetical protein
MTYTRIHVHTRIYANDVIWRDPQTADVIWRENYAIWGVTSTFQVMDFEKNGHGKSWKSHGILNGRRCTNPVIEIISASCIVRRGRESIASYAFTSDRTIRLTNCQISTVTY